MKEPEYCVECNRDLAEVDSEYLHDRYHMLADRVGHMRMDLNKIMNEYFNKEEIDKHECGKNYLKKRKDDNQETIITRYEEYMNKTKPVLDFYSSKSYFYEIDGCKKIDEISSKIEEILTV